MGWFYGFKRHLVISATGERLGVELTPSNIDGRKPVATLIELLCGKLYGDRSYISAPLRQQLASESDAH